ncbi:MAG: dehydrogenase [Candidatus Melainabacteria bacterium GWF2_37_15]|nr:MAG: dehydrogenase [Candidatus Melainabacteria bacterium GWF2_37_15]
MQRSCLLSPGCKCNEAFEKAFSYTPEEIINIIKDSGLRGRGGAGFPTGMKWEFAAKAAGEKKYVVCNADEGEPGTFKDRVLLTDSLDKLVQGMAIAGYAIGANYGILYLRSEYKWMLNDLNAKFNEFKNQNYLGNNIMGKGFDFDIEIKLNAGAYVCGEETALIESMEGKRGEPRNKPPFPVQSGYMGYPTVINNVETLCNIPYILEHGVAEFKKYGTERSCGTKLFSISGDCAKPGVYEMDLGITIREMLEMVGASNTKAVQIGGASGSTAGEKDFDKTICFEGFPPGGSIIIFNKSRNMARVLKNFIHFFEEESCGQCTPCREGTRRLKEAVDRIERGEKLSDEDMNTMLELAEVMKNSSKCGLGQTAANPFVDILGKFREDF